MKQAIVYILYISFCVSLFNCGVIMFLENVMKFKSKRTKKQIKKHLGNDQWNDISRFYV